MLCVVCCQARSGQHCQSHFCALSCRNPSRHSPPRDLEDGTASTASNGQRRSAATLDEPVSGSRSGFRRASTRVWDDQEVHGVWSLVSAGGGGLGCSVSLLYCRWISVCSSVYSPCAQSANLELIHAMHEPHEPRSSTSTCNLIRTSSNHKTHRRSQAAHKQRLTRMSCVNC